MKSTIHNLSGSAVVLPPTFDSLSLGAGLSVDKTYSNMPAADLAQLVALAKAGTIDFPGNVGSGIPAGLQVTPALSYVLNGQEPSGQPDGSEVFSINDNQRRRLKKNKWGTIDQDDWTHNTDCDRGFWFQVSKQLKDGRVMVVGGLDENFNPGGDRNRFYDPATDTWSVAPSLPPEKTVCSIMGGALLKNGKLLVGGGDVLFGVPDDNGLCYLFDPKTNTWAQTGTIPETFWGNASADGGMIVLDNGNVLYLGGSDSSFVLGVYGPQSRKVYLYNTAAGTWSATGLMAENHGFGLAYALPGNKAIVIGGATKYNAGVFDFAAVSTTYEIYDAGTFTSHPLPSVAGEDDALSAPLKGGRYWAGGVATKKKIVVVGGQCFTVADGDLADPANYVNRASIIVYDIDSGTWNTQCVPMPYPVTFPKLYVLDEDNVLIVGGYDANIGLPTARTFIYNIPNDTLTPSADMPTVYVPEFDAYLPYSLPDENFQGGISLSNGSYLNFLGAQFDTNFSFTPGVFGDTLTPDKKRGHSRAHRSFSGGEVLANKAKYRAKMKQALRPR